MGRSRVLQAASAILFGEALPELSFGLFGGEREGKARSRLGAGWVFACCLRILFIFPSYSPRILPLSPPAETSAALRRPHRARA